MKALNAEYETEVHFQKCYGVMAELFEAHDNLEALIPASGFKFLDLGCAPGGFSSFLLDDARCRTGFGVTLPSTSGGFPMRLRSNNFFLQQADLFEIGPSDLIASDVHICICDAQYLRNNISWDERYRGVRCRSKQHGVWALLVKQFWLGLTRLIAGGIFIFRFGWRDPGPGDAATVWYKRCTLRLFSLVFDLFEQVKQVKSDYFNALQSSFYVCCSNFNQEKFAERQVAKLLGNTFNYLLSTRIEDPNKLDILAQVDKIRTKEIDDLISDMLDRVQKLRMIHQESRRRQQRQEHDDSHAVVFIAPVPTNMSNQELAAVFSVYGRVRRVDRDGDREAVVVFTHSDHAHAACTSLKLNGTLGDHVRVWMPVDDVDICSEGEWNHRNLVSTQPQSHRFPARQYWATKQRKSGRSGKKDASKPQAKNLQQMGEAEWPSLQFATKKVRECTQANSSKLNSWPEERPNKAPVSSLKIQPELVSPVDDSNDAPSSKPCLHPALLNHQVRTRELITGLLKTCPSA